MLTTGTQVVDLVTLQRTTITKVDILESGTPVYTLDPNIPDDPNYPYRSRLPNEIAIDTLS